jgi:transposase InsO family protein
MVAELAAATGSQRQALVTAGMSRSTWHYRRQPRPRVVDPIQQKDRAYPSRISPADRAEIADRITAGWTEGHSVDHSFAAGWDDGVMLGSRRSWWRIAAGIQDQSARPVAPTRPARGHTRGPREAPVLEATGPGQVWSWDITDLRTPWRGVSFKAYSIIDIYSRKLVGWRVEEREADELAVEMFQNAFAAHGTPDTVHADSGPTMRSSLLKDFLDGLGITWTHSRPRVSNDNPFSESEFRTMKYRPNYPGTFTDLEHARAFTSWYVPWYNQHHKHSGIALFSPNEVHDGTWRDLWQQRERTQQAYYQAHPERFRARPRTPAPAGVVGINLPKTEDQTHAERLHAA